MLADDYLPLYDVSDSVATTVRAGLGTTWDALMRVDLIEVGRRRPLVGALGAIRMLPELVSHLLHGEPLPSAPSHMTLRDTASVPMGQGGWVLLGEHDRDEIALGLIGKFWRPVIEYARVDGPEAFRAFAEPGYAKTVYALSVRAIDDRRTLLTGTMRTATTDEAARTWFRRYWTMGVGSGAHVLVNGVLDVTREMAERAQDAADAPPPPG